MLDRKNYKTAKSIVAYYKDCDWVVAPYLIDIRLAANLSRAHVSRLSGISQGTLQSWERVCKTVPSKVVWLYEFYYACSERFEADFYLEPTAPVTDPTILAWVKSKGEKLSYIPLKNPWRLTLRLMKSKAERREELARQGLEPSRELPFNVRIPRHVLQEMAAMDLIAQNYKQMQEEHDQFDEDLFAQYGRGGASPGIL